MTTAGYDELARHWSRLHRFGHVHSIASWDRAAMMPTKGCEARAAALAEMDALLHALRTEPRLGALIAEAERESLDPAQCANLREIRRDWFATIRRATPDLDQRIARGDLAPVFDWLRENIWLQGSRWTTAELATRASGEALNPIHFRRHLETRYLGAATV